jgi:uncharacterized membrane protein YoaK (UPF0700 family)
MKSTMKSIIYLFLSLVFIVGAVLVWVGAVSMSLQEVAVVALAGFGLTCLGISEHS